MDQEMQLFHEKLTELQARPDLLQTQQIPLGKNQKAV